METGKGYLLTLRSDIVTPTGEVVAAFWGVLNNILMDDEGKVNGLRFGSLTIDPKTIVSYIQIDKVPDSQAEVLFSRGKAGKVGIYLA